MTRCHSAVRGRRWGIRSAQAIGGAILAIGLSACSGDHATPQASADASRAGLPVVEAVPRLVASADLKLPLNRYLFSVAETQQYGSADRELVHRCMLRFGFDLVLPAPADIGPRTWTERRYGLTDAAAAAVLGYGLGDREPSAHPDVRDQMPKLSPEEAAVLTGSGKALPSGIDLPPGGCAAQAQQQLAGPPSSQDSSVDLYLPQQLSQESFEASQQDPRVREVFRDWSQCMRSQGHAYDSPLDPFSDPRMQAPTTAAAIDTAVDDVNCKRSTNLVGRWYAVESAYQRLSLDKHRAELDAVATANTVTRGIMARVLGASAAVR